MGKQIEKIIVGPKINTLIMGANPETVSLIEKAKTMGLYAIVTDNNPNAYAKRYADRAIDIDALDVDALVQYAKENEVRGVLVGVAEALLPAYCEVCERLGLPCYSTADKFDIMMRKDLFKENCRKYGVPTVREYKLDEVTEADYPVIVKPVDSSSSKGITVCRSKKELDEAVSRALEFSKSQKYLIEEYMTGDEVVTYYVMQDGTPTFVGMCDRYTYKGKEELVQLPTAYIFPSRHIDNYMESFDDAVKRMIEGIGLKNGSIFFQCFVDKDGTVRIYEAGYRLNGAQEHIIFSKVSGIDAKMVYINYAITGKVDIEDLSERSNPKFRAMACKLSPLVKTGKIAKIKGLDEIRAIPGVISVNPSYDEGDTVDGEGTLKQIVCRFFIIAGNKELLAEIIDKIQSIFKVEDESGKDMLIGEFDTQIIEDNY